MGHRRCSFDWCWDLCSDHDTLGETDPSKWGGRDELRSQGAHRNGGALPAFPEVVANRDSEKL